MLGIIPQILIEHIPRTTIGNKRPGTVLDATSITIHNTGNPSSTAKNERGWLLNTSNTSATSFHYAVDQLHAVEVIPPTEIAWHAGNATGNRTSIGIEVCESGDQVKTWKHAVGLTAKILHEKGWGIDRVKTHKDWSGKICPRLILPRWNEFLKDVQETLNSLKTPKVEVPIQKPIAYGIATANVNVRTGPGTTYSAMSTGLTKGQKVDIYETKANWHRIGDSIWVSGDYISLRADVEWKYGGIDTLAAADLMSDPQQWIDKINEPMPVWAITIILSNIYNALKK